MSKHQCCYSEHNYCSGFYRGLVCTGHFLAPVLLLLLRVFFGALFVFAGLAKLMDASAVSEFFGSIGIPLPSLMVYLVGIIELFCGALLIVGFLTRFAVVPLIIVMIVAFATVHHESVNVFTADPTVVLVEKPFSFLVACLVIFCFGPGIISLDYLLERFVCKDKCDRN